MRGTETEFLVADTELCLRFTIYTGEHIFRSLI